MVREKMIEFSGNQLAPGLISKLMPEDQSQIEMIRDCLQVLLDAIKLECI